VHVCVLQGHWHFYIFTYVMSYCSRYSSDICALSNGSEILFYFSCANDAPVAAWTFFLFLFISSLFSSGTNWQARGRCYGYISPGLPVGAAHLLSWEMLTLVARPASDSSEGITWPRRHSVRQAALASLVDSLSHCSVVRYICVAGYFWNFAITNSLFIAFRGFV